MDRLRHYLELTAFDAASLTGHRAGRTAYRKPAAIRVGERSLRSSFPSATQLDGARAGLGAVSNRQRRSKALRSGVISTVSR